MLIYNKLQEIGSNHCKGITFEEANLDREIVSGGTFDECLAYKVETVKSVCFLCTRKPLE